MNYGLRRRKDECVRDGCMAGREREGEKKKGGKEERKRRKEGYKDEWKEGKKKYTHGEKKNR